MVCGIHQKKVITRGEAKKLAKAVGLDRKSIYAYEYLERSPKLDIVAKIMAYYGNDFIHIPLKDINGGKI